MAFLGLSAPRRFKKFTRGSKLDFEGDWLRNKELGLDMSTLELYLKQLGENNTSPQMAPSAPAAAATVNSPRLSNLSLQEDDQQRSRPISLKMLDTNNNNNPASPRSGSFTTGFNASGGKLMGRRSTTESAPSRSASYTPRRPTFEEGSASPIRHTRQPTQEFDPDTGLMRQPQ